MTLTVSVTWFDENDVEHDHPLASGMAGLESARLGFYGCPRAIALGLRLLPQLREQACVEINIDSFDEFLREVDRSEAMAREDDAHDSYWPTRLDNLRAAVAAALSHVPAGVVIIG